MIVVPESTIVAIPYDSRFANRVGDVFFNFNGMVKRDWFNTHAYRCLPLVMGNQHGFGLKSVHDFSVIWNGGKTRDDVTVTIHDMDAYNNPLNLQTVKSHFGMATVTIQTVFSLRTPPNVSLITIQPPNMCIDGIQNMMGVIETDNLRRDFTFNLRITRPNHPIEIKKGDVLSAVLPYPRLFIDNYKIVEGDEVLSSEDVDGERKAAAALGTERSTVDVSKPHGVGRRYHRGEDASGNKFLYTHQKSLKGCKEDV